MYPPNSFHVCPNPTPLNTALKRMNFTKGSFISSEKLESFQNPSIVNFDCEHAHKNKIQLKFFKCIINYYEQDLVTVSDVLKQQHYQTLIITNNEHKVCWGSALCLKSDRGIFHILSSY